MFASLLEGFLLSNDKVVTDTTVSPFRLPVQHNASVRLVPEAVLSDLELTKSQTSSPPMSQHLFRCETPFATSQAVAMMKWYTTDDVFLRDTQDWLSKSFPKLVKEKMYEEERLLSMVKDVQSKEEFMEKYYYIEWKSLDSLNRSSTFLQGVSVLNGIVPMVNVAMTFLILLLPLLVIFLYGKEWSLASYLEQLRLYGRDNLFSQLFSFFDASSEVTMQTTLVLMAGILLYGYQLYYNLQCTYHFFVHLTDIAENLCHTRSFFLSCRDKLKETIQRCSGKVSYQGFVEECGRRLLVVERILSQLSRVCRVGCNMSTLTQMGYLFECYYLFHADMEYQETLMYCMDFDGYYDNMSSLADWLQQGKMTACDFDTTSQGTKFKELFYPPFLSGTVEVVKNDVDLSDENYIVTGPNASGKTTLLKTVAINVLLSQQVGCGLYSSGSIQKPYDHIHSYINIPDTSERDSLFEAETRRCKDILTQVDKSPAGERHFCIFDELFSGTNPEEASSSAYSYLKFLCTQDHVDFILTTHYVSVCERVEETNNPPKKDLTEVVLEEEKDVAKDVTEVVLEEEKDVAKDVTEGVLEEEKDVAKDLTGVVLEEEKGVSKGWVRALRNYRMKVEEEDDKLRMKYLLERGISKIRGAVYILQNMGFPEEMMKNMV